MPTKSVVEKPVKEPEAHTTEGAGRSTAERTTDLSDEVLEQLEAGGRAAIEAVRKFMESVDRALPGGGESPSRAEIVDSALKMADKLVQTQSEALRKIIESAGWSVNREDHKR
jgi:hypothetical protein